MEIKKSNNLFVDSSGERQQRNTQPTPEHASFSNQLRDTADSFEALLARNRMPVASDVTQSLYLTQMQAQKSALLDEYASTLARLSHDFSRQMDNTGLHLSELIDHAEDPTSLSRLLSPLAEPSRLKAQQFIQTHQVQIHSLKLKNSEIQSFPTSLNNWLIQQNITPSSTTMASVPTPASLPSGDDGSRYQQISNLYQRYVEQLKSDYTDAENALLMEAQRSLPSGDVSLAQLIGQLEQPRAAIGTDTYQPSPQQLWLNEQQTLVEQFRQSKDRQRNVASLSDWARQNGHSHPWLHG